jgi:hypothetical protein
MAVALLGRHVAVAVRPGEHACCRFGAAYAPDGDFEPERMLAWLGEQRDRGFADGYTGMTLTGEIGEAFWAPGGAETIEEYERRLDAPAFGSTVAWDTDAEVEILESR